MKDQIDRRAQLESLMSARQVDRARARARAWGDRKRKVRAELEKAGLGAEPAEREAAELTDLLEWVEKVAKDVRNLSSDRRDTTGAIVALVIDFGFLEYNIPRFRRAIGRTNQGLGISYPWPLTPSRLRIQALARRARRLAQKD